MLSKELDSFFDGHDFVVRVDLTNGESVFLDDGRPGRVPSSAWLRLKIYCNEHNIRILSVSVLCEQGNIPLIENVATGLFSINRVAWLNGISVDMFNLGTVEGDKIRVASYVKKPFCLFEVTERPLEGNEWLVI